MSARDTVMAETPASFATSASVVLPVPRRVARRGVVTLLRGERVVDTTIDVNANDGHLLAFNSG